MSHFAETVRAYAGRYGVTPRDRYKLLAHWPLFRLFWLSEHGTGRAKRAAAAAYAPFARYRISQRVAGGDGGRMTVPVSFEPHDLQTFREIFLGQEYAGPVDLSGARTCVDLGANTGLASLHFLSRAPLRTLVAVEANPMLIPRLRENLAGPIAAGRVVVDARAVVGATGEPVRFFVADNPRHGSLDPLDGSRAVTVETVTLRALLDEHGLDRVDVLKMDVEGAEHDLLAADPGVFARVAHVFAEVHGDRARRDAFVRALEAAGFAIGRRAAQPGDTCETVVASSASG